MEKKLHDYLGKLAAVEKNFKRDLKGVRKTIRFKMQDEKKVLSGLKKLQRQYPSNPAVIELLLDFLQLSDDPAVYKQFSLRDISRLYKAACSAHPSDIDLNLAYFHFLWNVMDKEDRVMKMYSDFKAVVLKRFAEMDEMMAIVTKLDFDDLKSQNAISSLGAIQNSTNEAYGC